jgi:hypothetical protein
LFYIKEKEREKEKGKEMVFIKNYLQNLKNIQSIIVECSGMKEKEFVFENFYNQNAKKYLKIK